MVDRSKLTKRQREVYEFIREKIRGRGYGPTVREIGKAFGISSPNGVMCHLLALEKKGMITREKGEKNKGLPRAISLVHESPSACSLTLAGTVAAGLAVETFEQTEQVDFQELFRQESHFALKVRGDSMIEDHIADGDFVVVHKQKTARNGQIVVALVDGSETTLKRFFREGRRYRLEPSNRSMKPIYTNRVDIQGVVVGVVRKFA